MRRCSQIVVVEDDDAVADMVVDHLQSTVDAEVTRTHNAAETIQSDMQQPADLLLTDIILPDGNGLDLIRLLRSRSECPVLVMTGQPTVNWAVESLRLGVADLFIKPIDLQRLTSVVKESLAAYRARTREKKRVSRLANLTRKVIEERRELQKRVDLVCQDLVNSYRDLAERFASHDQFER